MKVLKDLEPFFQIYIACYVLATLAGAALMLRERQRLALFSTDYRKFLGQPWRLATFIIAAAGMTLVAPYTGDPTWDYFDAPMMSVLTFVTAPWVIGIFYLLLAGRARPAEVFIAAVLWMTSASWCYDLYILFKQGMYPITWAWNIAASSVLYACAGLMWNLDSRAGVGVVFAFREPGWPQPVGGGGFARIAWFALPFMLIAGVGVAYFLWTQL
jgi:hypothetical protein